MPAGVLTERGWKSKPKFKDGVAAWVAFDVNVNVNDDDDDDNPVDAHHLKSNANATRTGSCPTRKRSVGVILFATSVSELQQIRFALI
jgi:hypothetical protein